MRRIDRENVAEEVDEMSRETCEKEKYGTQWKKKSVRKKRYCMMKFLHCELFSQTHYETVEWCGYHSLGFSVVSFNQISSSRLRREIGDLCSHFCLLSLLCQRSSGFSLSLSLSLSSPISVSPRLFAVHSLALRNK